jgi:hypothetical protein
MELTQALVAIGGAIPGLLVIAAIIAVTQWATGVFDRFFDAIDAGAVMVSWLHQELGRPTKKLVRIVLWVIALMSHIPSSRAPIRRRCRGISLLLGVMVSLGSSNFVGNAVAGMALTYARAFSIGDRVKIGEHIGSIVSLGFFATKVRSVWNEEITIPNRPGRLPADRELHASRRRSGAPAPHPGHARLRRRLAHGARPADRSGRPRRGDRARAGGRSCCSAR